VWSVGPGLNIPTPVVDGHLFIPFYTQSMTLRSFRCNWSLYGINNSGAIKNGQASGVIGAGAASAAVSSIQWIQAALSGSRFALFGIT
jgi:hypothetical protein